MEKPCSIKLLQLTTSMPMHCHCAYSLATSGLPEQSTMTHCLVGAARRCLANLSRSEGCDDASEQSSNCRPASLGSHIRSLLIAPLIV